MTLVTKDVCETALTIVGAKMTFQTALDQDLEHCVDFATAKNKLLALLPNQAGSSKEINRYMAVVRKHLSEQYAADELLIRVGLLSYAQNLLVGPCQLAQTPLNFAQQIGQVRPFGAITLLVAMAVDEVPLDTPFGFMPALFRDRAIPVRTRTIFRSLNIVAALLPRCAIALVGRADSARTVQQSSHCAWCDQAKET